MCLLTVVLQGSAWPGQLDRQLGGGCGGGRRVPPGAACSSRDGAPLLGWQPSPVAAVIRKLIRVLFWR